MSTEAQKPNGAEIAYWNDEAGARWVEFQEHLDRAFAPLTAAALAAAAPQPGEAVLDIGCGCGATVLELAGAVGATGSVLGVDVSETMLAIAQRRAAPHHPSARFALADAATHPFDERAVDLAFSRFGVMFFDDPVAALANIRRSLRPAGRLVFICWRELAANPWFHVPLEAVRPHVPRQPKADPHAPGPLAFADPERVRAILGQAGFDDIRIQASDARLPLGASASATELLRRIGPTSRLLAAAESEGAYGRAVDALSQTLRRHETDGGVVLGAGVWTVVARPGP